MNEYIYKLFMPGVVEIKEVFNGRIIRLNKENIKFAIENVKREHNEYKTEKAYQRQLSKYQDALQYLL